jgi:hypothetical protein
VSALDELEGFQIAMLEALHRGEPPAVEDPAIAMHRDYVAALDPALVELTVKLNAQWHRIEGDPPREERASWERTDHET